jgi:hypothetical protein
MKRILAILLVVGMFGSAMFMGGCSKKEKTVAGALIGAGAGAGIGSAAGGTEGAVAGGLLGGVTGGLIGNSMKDDK